MAALAAAAAVAPWDVLAQPLASRTTPPARYASPNGSGTACTQTAPCSAATAILGAPSGSDVFLLADQGEYHLTAGINTTPGVAVNLHGLNGRPRLIFSDGGLRLSAGTAEDLYVENNISGHTSFALDTSAATAERVFAVNSADGHACYLDGAMLIDSICWADPSADLAVETDGSNTLRNVTAVGGTEAAIKMFGRSDCSCSSATDTLVNVIARSGPSGVDLEANSDGTVTTTISPTYSNYETVSEVGGDAHVIGDTTDQTAAPAFVDAAGGDFHQAPGSPTVDAGVNDPANGNEDFDGDPRTMGGTTDIGADELVEEALTVHVRGKGTVHSVPAGIHCPPDCSESFARGEDVKLIEHPRKGWHFTGWHHGGCHGRKRSCTVDLTKDRSVRATFARNV